jgi:hypothetical protein
MYAGPLCQDRKTGSTKSYFPPYLICYSLILVTPTVILRRQRREMNASREEKNMLIFFVSMAHHFPEHASQAVSRESEAALIPLETHARLAQPLRQHTPLLAQNKLALTLSMDAR